MCHLLSLRNVLMPKSLKITTYLSLLFLLVVLGLLYAGYHFSSASIHELLTENRRLSRAIHNLTAEEQIGYATLEGQQINAAGTLVSQVRLVQTAIGDSQQILSEQLFEIAGDVIHFDALIVKFSDAYVHDGRERALYLWRRIYGEAEAPTEGQLITSGIRAPNRYEAITQSLNLNERQQFWQSIWNLANDPNALKDYGVRAVYGNPIYFKMQPDRVYLFKINSSGQLFPEIIYRY